MAQYTAYAPYNIIFSDQVEYDFAIAVSSGVGLINLAPRSAAALFGIPFPYPSGDMNSIDKTITFVAPYTVGSDINHPLASGVILDDTVDSMLVPGQAGNPSSALPAGPDMLLVWQGFILFKTRVDTSDPTLVAPIPPRRFIGGLELQPLGEGGDTGAVAVNTGCRDSSRTIDGVGFPLRGNNINVWIRSVNEFTGINPKNSWERFYARVRTPPVAAGCGIWRALATPSTASGAGIKINPDNTPEVFNINNAGVETSLGTLPALNMNVWYLFDVLVQYNDGILIPGSIRVYINHTLVLSSGVTAGQGLDEAGQLHAKSRLGKWTAAIDNFVEIDLDDWINADIPNIGGTESLTSIDWLTGSHIREQKNVSGTSTNWTGNVESTNQGIQPDSVLNSTLLSTTSGAIIDVLTDVPLMELNDKPEINLGSASQGIGLSSQNAAGTNGSIGVNPAGAGFTDTVVDQLNVSSWTKILRSPTGMQEPAEISPFRIRHTKSADANSDTTRALQAFVEYIGMFGEEDVEGSAEPYERVGFLHNCRYPNTVWAFTEEDLDAPCYAVGGTYVGNGTTNTINLPAPCHFLWIRSTSGGVGGIKCFGASLGAHRGISEDIRPNMNTRMFVDSAGQAKFIVAGADADTNQAAVTYQYIAFCDPGMRFNLCGAYNHPNALTVADNDLVNPAFLAAGGFIQGEGNGGANSLSWKGPGFTGDNGVLLNGSNVVSWGNFLTGILRTRQTVHFNNFRQGNYSLWRTTDSECGYIMCQIGTYVGDGTASRVINLSPISGRFPLLAVVIPHQTTAAHFRDPSHAGSNSARVDTLANTATGITAGGVDQITVGITLNANGTNYDYFVILGNDVSWANGTYYPANCVTQPEAPPIPPLPEIAIMGEGGIDFDGTTPLTLLRDVTGIYTLVPGKTDDTLYDRQTGQTSVDVKIPDPTFKTGYIGG